MELQPKNLKKTALPFLAAVTGLAAVACGTPGTSGAREQTQDDPHKAQDSESLSPEIQAIVDTEDLLSDLLAFPMLPQYYDKIQIQQGWADHDASESAIDYINGQVDHSPWQEFVIAAAAHGKACIPEQKVGNAVLIRHVIDRFKITIDTYYGHFKEVFLKDLPLCKLPIESWIEVRRRQPLGIAGADGVVNNKGKPQPGWKHLHFQINKIAGNLTHLHPDGYALFDTREKYPTILNTRMETCAGEALLAACYRGHPDLAKAKYVTPTPTSTPKPIETPLVLSVPRGPFTTERASKGLLEALMKNDFDMTIAFFAPDKRPRSWEEVFASGLVPSENKNLMPNLTTCSGVIPNYLERTNPWYKQVTFDFPKDCVGSWDWSDNIRRQAEQEALKNNTQLIIIHPVTGQVFTPKNDIERAIIIAGIPNVPQRAYYKQLEVDLEQVNDGWYVRRQTVSVNRSIR